MRIRLSVSVGECIRMCFACFGFYSLNLVIVPPQFRKLIGFHLWVKENLETASLWIGNEAVFPAQK